MDECGDSKEALPVVHRERVCIRVNRRGLCQERTKLRNLTGKRLNMKD